MIGLVCAIASAALSLIAAYVALLTRATVNEARLEITEAKLELITTIQTIYPTRHELESSLSELRRRVENAEAQHVIEQNRAIDREQTTHDRERDRWTKGETAS